VAAAGTVSASPATTSTDEGSCAPIWLMISARPVPVSNMSRRSCQAMVHFTSPRSQLDIHMISISGNRPALVGVLTAFAEKMYSCT